MAIVHNFANVPKAESPPQILPTTTHHEPTISSTTPPSNTPASPSHTSQSAAQTIPLFPSSAATGPNNTDIAAASVTSGAMLPPLIPSNVASDTPSNSLLPEPHPTMPDQLPNLAGPRGSSNPPPLFAPKPIRPTPISIGTGPRTPFGDSSPARVPAWSFLPSPLTPSKERYQPPSAPRKTDEPLSSTKPTNITPGRITSKLLAQTRQIHEDDSSWHPSNHPGAGAMLHPSMQNIIRSGSPGPNFDLRPFSPPPGAPGTVVPPPRAASPTTEAMQALSESHQYPDTPESSMLGPPGSNAKNQLPPKQPRQRVPQSKRPVHKLTLSGDAARNFMAENNATSSGISGPAPGSKRRSLPLDSGNSKFLKNENSQRTAPATKAFDFSKPQRKSLFKARPAGLESMFSFPKTNLLNRTQDSTRTEGASFFGQLLHQQSAKQGADTPKSMDVEEQSPNEDSSSDSSSDSPSDLRSQRASRTSHIPESSPIYGLPGALSTIIEERSDETQSSRGAPSAASTNNPHSRPANPQQPQSSTRISQSPEPPSTHADPLFNSDSDSSEKEPEGSRTHDVLPSPAFHSLFSNDRSSPSARASLSSPGGIVFATPNYSPPSAAATPTPTPTQGVFGFRLDSTPEMPLANARYEDPATAAESPRSASGEGGEGFNFASAVFGARGSGTDPDSSGNDNGAENVGSGDGALPGLDQLYGFDGSCDVDCDDDGEDEDEGYGASHPYNEESVHVFEAFVRSGMRPGEVDGEDVKMEGEL